MRACLKEADANVELEITVEGSVDEGHYTAERITDLFYRNPRTKVYTSILQGVESSNPEVQKLLSNLLELYGDEADEALKQANAS